MRTGEVYQTRDGGLVIRVDKNDYPVDESIKNDHHFWVQHPKLDGSGSIGDVIFQIELDGNPYVTPLNINIFDILNEVIKNES